MATYYSTKAYVVRLTQSLRTELRKKKSKVKISALCPGPVKKEFGKLANVQFSIEGVSSEYVAKDTVKKNKKGKNAILPRFINLFIPPHMQTNARPTSI